MATLGGTNLAITLSTGELVTVTNAGSTVSEYPVQAFYRSTTPSGSSVAAYTAGRKFYAKTQVGTQFLAMDEYVYGQTSSFANTSAGAYFLQDTYAVASGTAYKASYIKQGNVQVAFGFSSAGPAAATDRIVFSYTNITPFTDGSINLGSSFQRFGTVYAVTGTINTSDINEKEQIQDLDAAEKNVALAIKGLVKKFKWKDSVAEKGDAARIHVGVMAQEVRDAFIAEGLDPERYAMFCKDVWWERQEPTPGKDPDNPEHAHMPDTQPKYHTEEMEGGVRHERYGVRYDQLLAFMIAAL